MTVREHVQQLIDALPEDRLADVLDYLAVAITSERDSNILKPSVQPKAGSLARSGCGIIPSTLRPGLQIPAILSSDPLGFASELTSPDGSV